MTPTRLAPWLIFFLAGVSVFNLATAPLYLRILDIGPISIGFFRLFFSLPFLALWILFSPSAKQTPSSPIKDRCLMLLAGLFFAGDLTLWNQSVQMTSIVNSCLLNNFSTFFVPLFATLFFRVTWSWIYLIAALVAFGGSILLTGGGVDFREGWKLGDLLALLSSFTYASYLVIVGELRKRVDTVTIFWWVGISCSLVLAIIAGLKGEPFWPTSGYEWSILVAYAFFTQLGGQALAGYVMGQLHPNFVVLILMLCPFCSTLLAWILFGETLTATQMLGGLIILGSVISVNYFERSKVMKIQVSGAS